MKKRRLMILLFLSCLVVGPGAQETQEAETPQTEEEILFDQPRDATETEDAPEAAGMLTVWSFVSMVLILAGVVAAIYGLFFLLKRMSGQNYTDNNLIRVLSTKTLSSTRAVHLLSLGKRYMLVGSAENGVNLIAEIDDKESRDEIEVFLAREDAPSRRSFRELIGGILPGSGDRLGETVSSSASFLKKQGSRVKNL